MKPKKKMRLHARPGVVLLVFPPAEEEQNGVAIPLNSQQRLELAEVYDVGEAVTTEDEKYRAWLLERQERSELVLVTFAAGTTYWRQNYNAKQWGWLRDVRAFTLNQPSAYLEVTEEPNLIVPATSLTVQ